LNLRRRPSQARSLRLGLGEEANSGISDRFNNSVASAFHMKGITLLDALDGNEPAVGFVRQLTLAPT